MSLAGISLGLTSNAQAAQVPGPIYKLASKPAVYVERHGTLHQIASVAMFYDLGYQWSQLHVVSQLPAPIGSPVKLFKLSTKPQVYLYQGGTLHWISSAQVFNAQGYQWDNVYDVAKLPAVIGSPVPQTSVLPREAVIMTGFPDVAVSLRKTFVIDAMKSNSNQVNSSYSGTASVTIVNNPGHLSVYNGSTWVSSGSVPVHYIHGQATIQVQGGSSPWGTISLKPSSQETGNFSNIQKIETVPNTTHQVGWRVFTPQGQPISGSHPAYSSSSSKTFVIEPVNAAGNIVTGTMADGVALMADPALTFCPRALTVCNTIGPYYLARHGKSFSYSGSLFESGTPMVFEVLPSSPSMAQVSQVTTGSGTSLSLSQPVPLMGTTQTVSGVNPNTSYTIKLQLFYAKGEPLTDLTTLSHLVPLSFTPKVLNASQRSSASTLGPATMGQTHIQIAYKSGSTAQVPDVLRLYGVIMSGDGVAPPSMSYLLYLITNVF